MEPGPKIGRPRTAEVEGSILRVTAQLLNEHGYRGFTLDDVVRRAHVSKATIYRRWASKELLVIAAFDTFEEFTFPEEDHIAERLFLMLSQNVGLSRISPMSNVLPALVGERSVNPALAQALDGVLDRRREPLRRAVREAIATGQLPETCDIELLLDAMIGPIFVRHFFYGNAPADAQTVCSVVALALRGVGISAPFLDAWLAQKNAPP
jgi:AcrR family transcriptional regulator